MSFHQDSFHQSDKIRKLAESRIRIGNLTLQIKSLNRTLKQLSKSDKAEDILQFEKFYAKHGRLINQLRNHFPTSVEWYKYYENVLFKDDYIGKEKFEQTGRDFTYSSKRLTIEGKVRGGVWSMFVNGVKTAKIHLSDNQSSEKGARLYADAMQDGFERGRASK